MSPLQCYILFVSRNSKNACIYNTNRLFMCTKYVLYNKLSCQIIYSISSAGPYREYLNLIYFFNNLNWLKLLYILQCMMHMYVQLHPNAVHMYMFREQSVSQLCASVRLLYIHTWRHCRNAECYSIINTRWIINGMKSEHTATSWEELVNR